MYTRDEKNRNFAYYTVHISSAGREMTKRTVLYIYTNHRCELKQYGISGLYWFLSLRQLGLNEKALRDANTARWL